MFKSYLLIQIKRLFRILPMALLFNFLTIAGICGIFALKIGTAGKSQSRIGVGIVGSIENWSGDVKQYGCFKVFNKVYKYGRDYGKKLSEIR